MYFVSAIASAVVRFGTFVRCEQAVARQARHELRRSAESVQRVKVADTESSAKATLYSPLDLVLPAQLHDEQRR